MRIVLPYKASIEAVVDLETGVITGFRLHRDTFDAKSAELPYNVDYDGPELYGRPDSPGSQDRRPGG